MIIVCGLIRPYTNGDKIAAGQNAVSTLVYIGVLSQWLVSIRRRFIQKEMKRYLAFAAFLMIFFGSTGLLNMNIVMGVPHFFAISCPCCKLG